MSMGRSARMHLCTCAHLFHSFYMFAFMTYMLYGHIYFNIYIYIYYYNIYICKYKHIERERDS